MYYQSYEEYMRDVLGYPQNSRMPTYNGYYNMAYQNENRDMEDVEIEKLYPEEVNDFKTKFTTLSTISFDKYKITLDPVFDGLTEYKNNYKFILIEITK